MDAGVVRVVGVITKLRGLSTPGVGLDRRDEKISDGKEGGWWTR